MSNKKIRVAILFGGRSGEHSISCATAAGVLREIDRDRYDVIPIGITRAGQWVALPDDPDPLDGGRAEVPAASQSVAMVFGPEGGGLGLIAPGEVVGGMPRVDVVLPLLHGPFGEDGTIQGLLELADLRYVGSGVAASAMGMDKHLMKLALEAAGLPVAPYVVAAGRRWRRDPEGILAEVADLGFPVFVKPARAGSSLGISRVERLEDVARAIAAAQLHDPKVLIEQGMAGREIECGVLGGRAGGPPRTSALGEIVVDPAVSDFYDYQTKYFAAGATLTCPADVPEQAAAEIRALAAAAFEALGCEGLARVDFFWDPAGGPVVNEINTMPGFTPISMFPRTWASTGMSYRELLTELIELALERPLGLR